MLFIAKSLNGDDGLIVFLFYTTYNRKKKKKKIKIYNVQDAIVFRFNAKSLSGDDGLIVSLHLRKKNFF